ncbi:uncharacterized protein LOC9646338 [Selaginella moellendorffii]|uniref:uncharacterized protein LOC9646338 n=1 Tax=Selaginella moellendorffii TaxID=88036 RepID=UPI000D1CEEF8|nr:uncharacterized protein LOC9646338 [Selaginella moellendorffii]XP_024536847.1 uncharacterized protein LOC9646338 [Selaginella moellendorffii]|eukprot:XP_002976166.2 uncharacterized protein LOC9646338 [Selaginella moellendorffii]
MAAPVCVQHAFSSSPQQCDIQMRATGGQGSAGFLAARSANPINDRVRHRQARVALLVKASSSLKDGERSTAATPADDRNASQSSGENVVRSEEIREDEEAVSGDAAVKGTVLAGLLLIGTVGGFAGAGYYYRDQINEFLLQFADVIEAYGPAGYAIFIAVYAGLEVLAIPAIPLTMSAGLLFGTLTGTVIVSVSGTIAATLSFLIARYVARDKILKLAEGNKKYMAIDKAIGENGFRVVALLRLSPLLPFSLGNYLYGLTSVKLVPYVLGSWVGMLPGTWAYVSAGAFGRALIQESESKLPGGPQQLATLGLGLLATVVAAGYVTRLAKDSIKDIE